jgi:hypothetical protein
MKIRWTFASAFGNRNSRFCRVATEFASRHLNCKRTEITEDSIRNDSSVHLSVNLSVLMIRNQDYNHLVSEKCDIGPISGFCEFSQMLSDEKFQLEYEKGQHFSQSCFWQFCPRL